MPRVWLFGHDQRRDSFRCGSSPREGGKIVMVTIACPYSLISVPLFRLCRERAPNAGNDIPNVNIKIASTGREALDRLRDSEADFALATEAAFNFLDPDDRDRIIEVAEISSHFICSLAFGDKRWSAPASINDIATDIRAGAKALLVTQAETNYQRRAKAFIDENSYKSTQYVVPYSQNRMTIDEVTDILGAQADYVVFLGLHNWLDEVEDSISSFDEFLQVYPLSERFEKGFDREYYLLYARRESVRGSQRNNLKIFRDIVIYLSEFKHNPTENVAEAYSHLDEKFRHELQRSLQTGDIQSYLSRIGLIISPRLAACAALIWKEEVIQLGKG